MPFNCSICETESTQICAFCTKDTCANHICPRCLRCSDCCTCEVALDEPEHREIHRPVMKPVYGVDVDDEDEDDEDDFEEDLLEDDALVSEDAVSERSEAPVETHHEPDTH